MLKEDILKLIKKAEENSNEEIERLKDIAYKNHYKVLAAFKKLNISEECFKGSTGYGYGDYGRENLDHLYAEIFDAEDAIVRPHLVSGTHTLSVALFGLLMPKDKMVSVTGTPYDTMLEVIGVNGNGMNSLKEFGVEYSEIPLNEQSKPDIKKIASELEKDVKLVLIQRSRGYAYRPSITITEIEEICAVVKKKAPQAICFVDNCYGEFVEEKEPLCVGADIIAGSLIKNPGGGIAPSGGYIAGKKDLIERISYRLTAPGIGREVGSSPGDIIRLLYQGIYLAPHTVMEALKGAIYTAALLGEAGFEVSPEWNEKRTDIVQAVKFNDKEKVIAFCQALQAFSPVDSHVKPYPWDMPGYEDQVIMAAGTFISGATSELSGDAPIREPYILYMQGGLSYDYVRIAVNEGIKRII